MSEDKKPENEQEQTVIITITEYLKMRSKGHKKLKQKTNRAETWILGQFRTYIEKKNTKVPHALRINEITVEDFDDFVKLLSEFPKTQKTYRSRMKGFQRYIELCMGLSKAEKNRSSKNPKLINLELQKDLAKTEKERDEANKKAAAYWKTIDEIKAEKDAEIAKKDAIIKAQTQKSDKEKDKECSQCKTLAEKDNAIRSNGETIAKLTTENKEKDRVFEGKKAQLTNKIQSLNQGLEKKNEELKSKQGEIASLTTDNEYLKGVIEEQSHDKLLEENQYLKVQLGQKDAEMESKKKRIGEVEKLIETEINQKGQIMAGISKMVRDFKAYMPSRNERCKGCPDGFSVENYVQNCLKNVTNLEDYIKGLSRLD